ncbi:MAG TPA: glycosyltransferase [Patescibacteria group bacterium]
MKISVIVTNWNGLELLKKYLISVIEASPEADEIILADDASQDSSLEYVKSLQSKYPKLKILAQKTNQGFAKNSNDAVRFSAGDYLVFLNSDIKPHLGYIKNALPHFQDSSVFGVGFSELGNENWAKIFWKDGYLQYSRGGEVSAAHITGWLSGGGSVIRKDYFLKMGGFDTVYEPFYSEDLDLGYRAWKSGYKLIWEPQSVIEHCHESTTSKFPKRFLDYVKERNRLLVILRNITDKKLLTSNKWAMLGRCLTGPNYIKIIRAAYAQAAKYPSPVVFPTITDHQIFDMFSDNNEKN